MHLPHIYRGPVYFNKVMLLLSKESFTNHAAIFWRVLHSPLLDSRKPILPFQRTGNRSLKISGTSTQSPMITIAALYLIQNECIWLIELYTLGQNISTISAVCWDALNALVLLLFNKSLWKYTYYTNNRYVIHYIKVQHSHARVS